MFRAKHTPPLSYLLDDLLTSDSEAIAAHLGVSVQTFNRWKAKDEAPRAALLALFYESRWGYSLMETTAENGRICEMQWRKSLQKENAMLRARIDRLEKIGSFGAANAPVLAVNY